MLKFATCVVENLFAYQAKGTIKRVRLGRTGTSLKVGLLGMANIWKVVHSISLSNLMSLLRIYLSVLSIPTLLLSRLWFKVLKSL